MTVVIAGCGDLGTEAGLRFLAGGHQVLGLRRSPEVLPAGFARLAIDLSTDVPALPADTSIVLLATSADGRNEAAYRSAYVDSTANMLQAIRRDCARPPRVVLVSSTAVHPVDDGGHVDEDSPLDPTAPTARLLVQAETTIREATDIEGVVLRLGGIYGPGRGRLIAQARDGGGTPRAGMHFTNRIHRDDAAAAIVHLATMSAAPKPVYLGVDDCPADREEVLQFVAHRLGVDRPAAPDRTSQPPTGKRCDNTRLRDSGFSFGFPTYREGYTAILAGSGTRHR